MRPYSSYASNPNRRARPRPNGARKWGGNNNATLESHGPNVKIRGTAAQIAERYLSLARDALASDRVKAESYYQHAEHYLRVAQGARNQGMQGMQGNMQGNRRPYGSNNDGQAPAMVPDEGVSMNEAGESSATVSMGDQPPSGDKPTGETGNF